MGWGRTLGLREEHGLICESISDVHLGRWEEEWQHPCLEKEAQARSRGFPGAGPERAPTPVGKQ